MPTDATRCFAYLNNTQNTAQGEGANAAKRTDRDGMVIDLTNLAEMFGLRYANGANCPDNGSGFAILSIFLQASALDGANTSRGIVNVGEYFQLWFDDGLPGGVRWEGICIVPDVVTVTVADLVEGVNPANYAACRTANLHILVRNGGEFKITEALASLGTGGRQINSDSIVAQANSTAAGWFVAGNTMRAILDAWATGANKFFTPQFAAWLVGVIPYSALASDALQTTRPGLLAPFHERFPIPWNIGGAAFYGVYYPPGWLAGDAAPAVSNRTTLAAALVPGGRYAWQLELGAGQSTIGYVTRTTTTATCFNDDTITVYLLLRTTAAHTNAALSVIINDGVGSTTTVIAGSGAGGLSANYAWFTATHQMNSASTGLNIQLLNNTGGGVSGVYIAQVDVQVTTINSRRHLPQRPSLQLVKYDFDFAGLLAAGYWNYIGTASNTKHPAIWGDIQSFIVDVFEATAPIGAPGDIHELYIEGVPGDGLDVPTATNIGDSSWTPAGALTIAGAAEPGARIWLRCRAIGTVTPGADATASIWAYVLKV